MKLKSFTFAILWLASSTVAPIATNAHATDEAANNEAFQLLNDAATRLSAASTFSAEADVSFDVVQPSGRKLQFGAEYELKAARPHLFYARVKSDDGRENAIYYDGSEVTLVNLTDKLYASAPHKGDINSAVDLLLHRLDANVPLSILLRDDLAGALNSLFPYGAYVSNYTLGDQTADHLVFSNERIDLQLWLDQTNADLTKAVITYKTEAGAPQYSATFGKWKLGKKLRTGDFSFQPDGDFDRIEFLETKQ